MRMKIADSEQLWRRLGAAVGVVGAGGVIAGTALAVYSRFFASTYPLPKDEHLHHHSTLSPGGVQIAAMPGLYATVACWLGLGMTIALVITVIRIITPGREYFGAASYLAMAAVAGLAVFPIVAIDFGASETWTIVRNEYQWFGQLPTALAAGALVTLGTLLALPILTRPLWVRELPSRALAAVLVVAVLAPAVIGFEAVRAGDDALDVDRTVAARVTPVSSPDRLGDQRYRIPISTTGTREGTAAAELVAAGTGFVTAGHRGITAYDGVTGAERWHYLRKPPGPAGYDGIRYVSGTLSSLDGGAVVIADWNPLGWIAFDAVTGETLWQGGDITRDTADRSERAEIGWAAQGAPMPLIVGGDRYLRGYDPRTGRRLWSSDGSESGCTDALFLKNALTDSAVYTTLKCRDGAEYRYLAIALDAHSGATLGVRELFRQQDDTTTTPEIYASSQHGTVVIGWNTGSGNQQLTLRDPAALTTATAAADEIMWPIAADPNGPDIVRAEVPGPGDDQFIVRDVDTGSDRYQLSGMAGKPDRSGWVLIEPTEIIAPAALGSITLRSWHRGDGSPDATPAASDDGCRRTRVFAVAGAVALLCERQQTAEVIGYVTG